LEPEAFNMSIRAAHVPAEPRAEEVAPGVYRVETGRVITEANVYLVRSGPPGC